MKYTDQELGEIGARAAHPVQMKTDGEEARSLHPANNADERARTAFAAAVREAIFAGVEGMPSAEKCETEYLYHRGSHGEAISAVRNLMLAAFAKQMESVRDEYSTINAERQEAQTLRRVMLETMDKLAVAEKRLGEITKLPEKWVFSTKPGSTYYANQLEAALKPELTAEEIKRAEFEQQAKSKNWNLERMGPIGDYLIHDVQMAWEGWKLARAAKENK